MRDLCRSLDGLPLAIELAAARTRTLSVDEIARRLDDRFAVLSDPTSRQPERRRALRATIGWSYDLLFPDDQRGLWALATFAGGGPLAAVESVLGALDVPPAAAIDIVGRLASRSLVIVDEPRRYRLLDSIRAFALETLDEAGLTDRGFAAHAAWYAARAAASTAGVRSGARRSTSRSPAPSAPTSTPRWPGARPRPAPGTRDRQRVRLGLDRARRRPRRPAPRAALATAGETAPASARADARSCCRGSRRPSGDLEPARRHVAEARDLASGDRELEARSAYYLAYVVSHHGDWQDALALTDRARELYEGLDRPWDLAANGLFAARAAISAGDLVRAAAARDEVDRWLGIVDDPWLHVRRDAMLGELARVEHRFDDAVALLGRAAVASGRLGFLQTEAYQLTSLGRAQCQAGDYEAGAATLDLGIAQAAATGDVRLAALGRVHLGRDPACARTGGGGPGRAGGGGRLPPGGRRRRAAGARRRACSRRWRRRRPDGGAA